MAQQVVVTSRNEIRVIETGPVGPRGPAGPAGDGASAVAAQIVNLKDVRSTFRQADFGSDTDPVVDQMTYEFLGAQDSGKSFSVIAWLSEFSTDGGITIDLQQKSYDFDAEEWFWESLCVLAGNDVIPDPGFPYIPEGVPSNYGTESAVADPPQPSTGNFDEADGPVINNSNRYRLLVSYDGATAVGLKVLLTHKQFADI